MLGKCNVRCLPPLWLKLLKKNSNRCPQKPWSINQLSRSNCMYKYTGDPICILSTQRKTMRDAKETWIESSWQVTSHENSESRLPTPWFVMKQRKSTMSHSREYDHFQLSLFHSNHFHLFVFFLSWNVCLIPFSLFYLHFWQFPPDFVHP